MPDQIKSPDNKNRPNLYAIMKEQEAEMTRIREATWEMERNKKLEAKEEADRKHQELVEAMKSYKGGIQFNNGGDANISDSNLAGRDLKIEQGKKDSDNHWYKKPVGIIIIGVTTGAAVLFIRALLIHFYPQWFS
jgi:hypothetical protein